MVSATRSKSARSDDSTQERIGVSKKDAGQACYFCGRTPQEMSAIWAPYAKDEMALGTRYLTELNQQIARSESHLKTLGEVRGAKGLRLRTGRETEEQIRELAPQLLPLLQYVAAAKKHLAKDESSRTELTLGEVLEYALTSQMKELETYKKAVSRLAADLSEARSPPPFSHHEIELPWKTSAVLPESGHGESFGGRESWDRGNSYSKFWDNESAKEAFEKMEKAVGKRASRKLRVRLATCPVCSEMFRQASTAAYREIHRNDDDE